MLRQQRPGRARTSSALFSSTPSLLSLGNDVGDLLGGSEHYCARRKSNGALLCWGNNQHGQLGRGNASALVRTLVTPPF
ncbi:MAG: hypothetical protein IPG96_07520 [Proteobacteria bacterium]|nr:hypothetical protein [Pseudomonadota bacterium]